MTTEEFSSEFDVLLDSFSLPSPFGSTYSPLRLDEYEKSVLLTKAQEDIIVGLYSGNLTGQSFEETEALRRALNPLVHTMQPTVSFKRVPSIGSTFNSSLYSVDPSVWFITYESVKFDDERPCVSNLDVQVVPMRQDEWNKVRGNPFRRPNGRRVVRIDSGHNLVELLSKYPVKDYTIKYLEKPAPIILTSLKGSGVTIGGRTDVSQCSLHESFHRVILERAVQLAKTRLSRDGAQQNT